MQGPPLHDEIGGLFFSSQLLRAERIAANVGALSAFPIGPSLAAPTRRRKLVPGSPELCRQRAGGAGVTGHAPTRQHPGATRSPPLNGLDRRVFVTIGVLSQSLSCGKPLRALQVLGPPEGYELPPRPDSVPASRRADPHGPVVARGGGSWAPGSASSRAPGPTGRTAEISMLLT